MPANKLFYTAVTAIAGTSSWAIRNRLLRRRPIAPVEETQLEMDCDVLCEDQRAYAQMREMIRGQGPVTPI